MEKKELDRQLSGMNLRQKIGQLLICGFYGTEVSDELKRFVEEYKIGGVIYFARNVESASQVGKLSASLQEIAASSGNVPLWISIDQEGGMVARITEGVALMPGQMAIAAAGSLDAAYESALISGKELHALGINLNYAPVLDVNNNALNPVIGVRSFGESPEETAEYGARIISGLQDAGVSATAKHFPGHGDTDVDSHLDLPTVLHDRERMERIELVPFRKAITEGVDAIMSAHIYFPALEQEKVPVTLSNAVLTGLLREELGFEGIIMTDCMEMNAIAVHYGTVAAAVMAIEAGADSVLISHRQDLQIGAIEAIEKAVLEGRLTEDRIDASVRRLLAYKSKRGVWAEQGSVASAAAVVPGIAEHMDAAARISEASMTLICNEQGYIPLQPRRMLAVTVSAAVATMVDELFEGSHSLGAALAKQGVDVLDVTVKVTDVAAQSEAILAAAADETVEQLVIGTYNAQFNEAQIELVGKLQELGKPLVVVALRNPYDLLKLPEGLTFAAAYESRPLALQSMAKALVGAIPFKGRLPVSLGERYPAGLGITQ